MQYYRIYVRLKNGGQAIGRELHSGPPPDQSTVLEVALLSGRSVKARIDRFRRGSMKKGTGVRLVTELYADEI
jgi:hypothetical protein